jgi:hypothetical protein
MLCAKCQKNEATVHLTMIVDGKRDETIHLCKDCAPAMTGLQSLDPKDLQALSVIGKKCEFCGKEASSGQMAPSGGGMYWCFDCGLEFGRILTELLVSERPELLQRSKEESSFFAFYSDPELQAWSEAANQKAVRILKDRRKQDGRDKPS